MDPTRAEREVCACIVLLVEKLGWPHSEKGLVLNMFPDKDFQTGRHRSLNNKDHGHLHPVTQARGFSETKSSQGKKPKDTTK